MIFIGYDEREHRAAVACQFSIGYRTHRYARFLRLAEPDVADVFDRPYRMEDGQFIDGVTGAPFSTEFSFSRFLVPYLASYQGWHVFLDCDFLVRADMRELFGLADDRYAVMVVQHQHTPAETVKMDGCEQTTYPRKNWSSLVLWNAAHPANAAVTPDYVATARGLDLHGFRWLKDEEIGALPLSWNYLVGYNTPEQCPDPKAVHFTAGGPWWKEYADVEYADEWREMESAYADDQ